MKKLTNGTLETRVARFLFNYRITPQTTTGVSPSELLLGRRLRCHLDFLRPNLEVKVRQTQCRQKELHDFHARDRELVEGYSVLVKNFNAGNPWLPGMIHSKTGPSSFTVDLTDGRRVRRHLDQLRKNTAAVVDELTTETVDDFPTYFCAEYNCRVTSKRYSPAQGKIFNYDALIALGVLPSVFKLTLIDSLIRRGGMLYVVCTLCMYMLYIYVAHGCNLGLYACAYIF